GYGRAVGDVIQRNRIHDCGRVPSSNHDHGIYLAYSDNTKVLDNVIFDNADRGVQFYPDAQGTVVKGNVIDGNGEGVIFSGAGGRCAGVLAGASVPAQPDFRPDKQEVPPPTTSGGSTTTVTVTQATFGHYRHHRRWRLWVAGRIRGAGGTHVGYVQVRRFGRWQRVGTHRLHRRFRFGVRAAR